MLPTGQQQPRLVGHGIGELAEGEFCFGRVKHCLDAFGENLKKCVLFVWPRLFGDSGVGFTGKPRGHGRLCLLNPVAKPYSRYVKIF